MKNGKLVIIGGDAAGMTAASKVRREQTRREIVVFERGSHTSYASCGIPYYVSGMVSSYDHLIAREPSVFREKHNIDVRVMHEVVEIDTDQKYVKVRDLKDGKEFLEPWGELLIATGASPAIPPVKGADAEGIFGLSTLQSGIDVLKYIEKNRPASAVLAGGGYIGIEMAEALLDRGMNVSMIDMAPQVMSSMDKDMAEQISAFMAREGVEVFLEEKLESFEIDKHGRVKAVISNKQSLEADLVIMGLGVKPNSGLAKTAGIETGAADAIRVNNKLQTSVPYVWAAGDCAESWHLLKERQVYVPLGTVANKQGLVAGINISGGEAQFPGVLGTAITKFRDMEISRTGLSEKEAQELGIKYKTTNIDSPTLSIYYPGTGKMSVKLVAEEKTGRLVGGQIVGMNGSAKRIDTIATAITARMTAQQLMDLDLSYAPPFSPVWDPVQIAARTLI